MAHYDKRSHAFGLEEGKAVNRGAGSASPMAGEEDSGLGIVAKVVVLALVLLLPGCKTAQTKPPEKMEASPATKCVGGWVAASVWWSCNRDGYDGPEECPQWQEQVEERCPP